MFIIPLDHDHLTVNRLPFVTIGIIILCVIVYFPTSAAMEKDQAAKLSSLKAFDTYRADRPYLQLPDDVVVKLPASLKQIYKTRQEWVAWNAESPDEVSDFLEDKSGPKQDRRPGSLELEKLIENIQALPNARKTGLSDIHKEMALNTQAKVAFLSKLTAMDIYQLETEQEELNRLFDAYKKAEKSSLVSRFAYTPSKTSIFGFLTHQFLHGGVFHLLFNMLFLWLAAVKLEDTWTRPLFLGCYLFFGIIGAIAHGLANADSTIPMIGASGAVAGLMGAFMMRYGRAEIKFFYFYILGFRPRYGTFNAPAYVMLPLWFAGELFYAFMGVGSVAYWAHVGGFLGGVVLVLVFKFTRFEERVLGRQPEKEIPQNMPLVAFQNNPAPLTPIETTPTASQPEAEKSTDTSSFGLDVQEIAITDISKTGLEGTRSDHLDIVIDVTQIAHIAVGRIDSLLSSRAKVLFRSGSIPDAPALIFALVTTDSQDHHQDLPTCFLIDGAKLNYHLLMRKTSSSLHQNFVAFVKFLLELYSNANYVPGPGPVAENNLPRYADLDLFFSHLTEKTRN